MRQAAQGYDPQWMVGFNKFVEAGLTAINLTLTATTLATEAGGFGGGSRIRAALNTVDDAAKGSTTIIEEAAVHGNSLKSLKPTWGYKLYSNDATFLKNGITSKVIPETRYSKSFMSDKYMVPIKQFPNRLEAWQWEYRQNQILRGPLNKNMH